MVVSKETKNNNLYFLKKKFIKVFDKLKKMF